MLELAIAEAYRPCVPTRAPKVTSVFPTNPYAKSKTFSLRSRPASAHSGGSSTYSQPRSFRSFVTRRKRLDSVLSSATEEPKTHPRSDSIGDGISLPQLPPRHALPPQDELEEYDNVLLAAIDDVQAFTLTNSHDLATTILTHLAHIADITACTAESWAEFWALIVHAAKLLCSARVGMSAVVRGCAVKALEQIAKQWNKKQGQIGARSAAELARVPGEAFDEILLQRSTLQGRVHSEFARWLNAYIPQTSRPESRSKSSSAQSVNTPLMTQGSREELRILTPSPSSAFLTVLVHAISTHSQRTVHLTTLFADPNDPSIPETLHILPSSSESHIHTTHLPFSNLGSACQDINVLLLEADSIDTQGNVRSAIGTLAAAVCAKSLARDAIVVGLVSMDGIVARAGEEHTDEDGEDTKEKSDQDVKLLSSEVVHARWVDAYVTEMGPLTTSDLSRLARSIVGLEQHIFGEGEESI